jgi:hypothetical protein
VSAHPQVFKREGDYWTIAFDGQMVRMRDAKGIRYLSVLLRHPGEPLPAWTIRMLAEGHGAADAPSPGDTAAERARITVTKGIRAVLTKLTADHPTLAEHLAATVRRGHLCVYRPDPRLDVRWTTDHSSQTIGDRGSGT